MRTPSRNITNITEKQNRLVVKPAIELVVNITTRNHVKSAFISTDLNGPEIIPRSALTNIQVFIDINIGLKELMPLIISSIPLSTLGDGMSVGFMRFAQEIEIQIRIRNVVKLLVDIL